MRALFFSIFFILGSLSANASFIHDLEAQIAKDQNFDNVIVSINVGKAHVRSEELEVNNISYDGKMFQADCLSSKGKQFIIGGKFDEAIEVPALKSDSKLGYIITEDDLVNIKVSKSKNLKHVITNSEEVIGKELKRNVAANKVISKNDMRLKTLLAKGDEVKIVYQKNRLQIEARGQALESGGQDELIRVKNLDSNKTLQARIVDSQTVLLGNS